MLSILTVNILSFRFSTTLIYTTGILTLAGKDKVNTIAVSITFPQ